MQMDEHTDWVNQLIYIQESDCLLEAFDCLVSCSNDTTIKLWMLPKSGQSLPYIWGEVP